MSTTVKLASSLATSGQYPLNKKTYFNTVQEMTENISVKALSYQEDMICQCVENHNEYIWRERVSSDNQQDGVLQNDFTYPTGAIANGITYTNRDFNFFVLKRQGEKGDKGNDGDKGDKGDKGDSWTKEIITIDNVDYQYRNNSVNGTFQNPSKYDIAEYGIRTVDSVEIVTTLMYSGTGDKSLMSSWNILREVELPQQGGVIYG